MGQITKIAEEPDFALVMTGKCDKQVFLERYGHLRPGTYDILSLRYDQRKDLFETTHVSLPQSRHARFELAEDERRCLAALLAESGLDHVTPDELLRYARLAIVHREHAKFV